MAQSAAGRAGRAGASSRLLPDQAFKVQEDPTITTEPAGNTAGRELRRSHEEVGNMWGSCGGERGEDHRQISTRREFT